MDNTLPVTEELDFAYLLELMRPLHNQSGFSWLPELFSIIGYEKLIDLCRYSGGETITIPTIEELSLSISALQWYYDTHIKKTKAVSQVPESVRYLYDGIVAVYDARNN